MNEQVPPRAAPGAHSDTKPLVKPPGPGHHHDGTLSQGSSTSNYSGSGYGPKPGIYVVQVPKDQIYRVPPPENAHKYKLYTQKKAHKTRCKLCMCTLLGTILILATLIALIGEILYLIYKPMVPSYSIKSVHIIEGNNISTNDATFYMPQIFNVTLRTQNNNGKIGIYYEQGGKMEIYHGRVNLGNSELPVFYQPPRSVTVFWTVLNGSGSGIVLSKPARDMLVIEQKRRKVPLDIAVKIPVKVKIGSVKSWIMTVEVSCDVKVNELTASAKVVSKKCNVNIKPW